MESFEVVYCQIQNILAGKSTLPFCQKVTVYIASNIVKQDFLHLQFEILKLPLEIKHISESKTMEVDNVEQKSIEVKQGYTKFYWS